MIGLIKTDDNLYHFCGFKDDTDAEERIGKVNYKRGVVAYECRDDGFYRIIAGLGSYKAEPYTEGPKRLLPDLTLPPYVV